MKYSRRSWMKKAALAQAGLILMRGLSSCGQSPNDIKTILVLSGWQYRNIGGIAHATDLLNVLETFLPDTNIIQWNDIQNQEAEDLAIAELKEML